MHMIFLMIPKLTSANQHLHNTNPYQTMNPIKFIFLAFIIIPFIEIYMLLQIGGVIGPFLTILLVVSTAIIGVALLKREGLSTWQRLQDNMAQGQLPALEIIEGALLLIGGALLLTPGFFTDMIGFSCLISPLRKKIARYIAERQLIKAGMPKEDIYAQQEQIIEGEFTKEE